MKRSVIGMLTVAVGVSVFSIQDVIVKALSGVYPVHEIVVLRCLVALPVLIWLTGIEGRERLHRARAGLHILRGLLLFVAYSAYYLAIASLPLAEVVAICFMAPLLIAALAWPVLGERVGGRSWVAVGVGFAGVLVVVRPSGSSDPAALLPLASAAAYSVSALLARRLGTTESGSAMALSATLVYLVAGSAAAVAFSGFTPDPDAHASLRFLINPWAWPSLRDGGLLAICGLIAAAGFFCLSQGYRLAEASRAASFEYVALPWAVLWGWLFFGAVPDLPMIGGAMVVIATGLYTLRQAQSAPLSGAAPPLLVPEPARDRGTV